jgi:hypothetical protein
MNPVAIRNFIGVWLVLIISISLLSVAHSWVNPNPIVRERLEIIEAFATQAKLLVPEDNLETGGPLSPSEIETDARDPYLLLKGVLPPHSGPPVSPTSKACYEADFQTRLERTGNFKQFTNNYKRGVPDSCSAPNHDLTLSFYKVEPLA